MKAVAYIRVSSQDQVDGHSLDAQARLFYELCVNRGWEPVFIYREEGRSANVDSIAKRPIFRQLLDDAFRKQFDVAVVHTLDRWSRNTRIALESLATLAKHDVALVSITENIDYSTAHCKLLTTMLAGFAKFFSDSLGTHIKKGISERALQGRHLGGIPFGYSPCWEGPRGDRHQSCDPEHPGGVHPVPKEAEAVRGLFHRYTNGCTTLSQLGARLNAQGLRTRNRHKLSAGKGNPVAEPRLFTTASVRGILHNPFYSGKIKHKDQLLAESHQALISDGLFQQVQSAMKRNSGRSQTLHPRPDREYLLKGLIRCAHCGLPM